MKISLQLPSFKWPGGAPRIHEHLKEIAKATEAAGFSSIWTMDHFFQIDFIGPVTDPMLEGYSVLSFLAALTKKVRLGTMVTGVVYRHPGILIKTVTTLDVLSGGRANLGIGAAWFEREAIGLGIPFPPKKERFEQLEETLQIVKLMWSGNDDPYLGKHYQLAEPMNSPQPISSPHPPILIGGSGEKKTLRLVAQYADACNLFSYLGTNTLKHKLKVLKNHCNTLNRNYDEIERTVLGSASISSGKDKILSEIKNLTEIGIQHVIYNMSDVHKIAPIERFGEEIIPAVVDW